MSQAAREHKPCAGARLCRGCAAAYVGVSIDVFDERVRKDLPKVRIGAREGFLRTDLDAWLSARREAPCPVQQSQRSSSAGEPGTTRSRSEGSAFEARRASEIADGLKPISPRAGSRNTKGRASRLLLVPE